MTTRPDVARLALRFTVGALVVICCLAAFVPLAPTFPKVNLDSGWGFALNVAVAKGFSFGRDIVFTFGPYAAAYTRQYYPQTDAMMLWSTAFLALAFANGLLCLGARDRFGRLILPALLLTLVTRDVLFLGIPVAFLVIACRSAMTPDQRLRLEPGHFVNVTLGILAVASSMISLVKGTFAVEAIAVLFIACTLLILSGRRAIALSCLSLYVVGLPVLWMVAHQPLAALPAYFTSQVPVFGGYTDAMSVHGSSGPLLSFTAGFFALMVVCARCLPPARMAGFALFGGIVLVLFLSFKAGFVRQDGHILISAGMFGLVALLLAVGFNGSAAILSITIGVLGWAVIDSQATGAALTALPSRLESVALASSSALEMRLRSPELLDAEYADSLRFIDVQQPLPHLRGSTDIYSFGQSAVLSAGLDWSPRPVFQSYAAFNPQLEALNERFVAGSGAPRNVLFTIEPIDTRLPSLEDAASWPIILARYRITDLRGNVAVLQRRDNNGSWQSGAASTISSGTFVLGQPVTLPTSEALVWAQLDVRPTLLGKLVSAAYKLPELHISYGFADGRQLSFRYIADMGHVDFLAVPLVQSTTDFVALTLAHANTYFAARRPATITVTAVTGTGWLWQSAYSLRFATRNVPAQSVERLLLDRVDTAKSVPAQIETTPDCAIDSVNDGPVANSPLAVGAYLRVEGWGAMSGKDGIAPDAASIYLVASNGTVKLIHARMRARTDVNQYFHQPAMGPVGYLAEADVSRLHGVYSLGVEISRRGATRICTIHVPLRIGGAAAAHR